MHRVHRRTPKRSRAPPGLAARPQARASQDPKSKSMPLPCLMSHQDDRGLLYLLSNCFRVQSVKSQLVLNKFSIRELFHMAHTFPAAKRVLYQNSYEPERSGVAQQGRKRAFPLPAALCDSVIVRRFDMATHPLQCLSRATRAPWLPAHNRNKLYLTGGVLLQSGTVGW